MTAYTPTPPSRTCVRREDRRKCDFPVFWSPTTSSRWPFPIGIIRSMSVTPVLAGRVMRSRVSIPDGTISKGRASFIGGRGLVGSIEYPNGSMVAPRTSPPNGNSRNVSVRATREPIRTASLEKLKSSTWDSWSATTRPISPESKTTTSFWRAPGSPRA